MNASLALFGLSRAFCSCPSLILLQSFTQTIYLTYVQFDDDVLIEYTVARDEDDATGGFSVSDRVYVAVDPSTLMGADEEEIRYTIS
jgi:hypothetical protein